jgi:iron(III) transport system permease protein
VHVTDVEKGARPTDPTTQTVGGGFPEEVVASPEPRQGRRWRGRIDLRRPEFWIGALCLLVLAWLALVPLAFLLWNSVRDDGQFTLQNFADNVADPYLLTLLKNTTTFSLGSTLLSLVIGTFFAWVIERTNTPMKKLFFALSLVPLVIPNLLFVISWVILASPEIGVLNQWAMLLGFSEPPLNIFSIPGMIFVDGLHSSPIVFLLMTAAFRSMDPALEEAAQMSGASIIQTTRRITMRLAWPGLVAAMLITFLRAFESFETPAILGLPVRINVFTSEIYTALRFYPPDRGSASTYSIAILIIAMVLLYFHNRSTRSSERYQTITGKGFRPRTMDLGRFKFVPVVVAFVYFTLLVLLPLGVLMWTSLLGYSQPPTLESLQALSFDNYRQVFDYPLVARAARNSVLLSLAAAVIVVLLTAFVSWIVVKSKAPGRGALDSITFLPIVFPGVVLGSALLFTYLALPLPIYGTAFILLIAYVTKFLPYGIRYNKVAMLQIHTELEESARMSGASWWQGFSRVTLPLLKPGMMAAFIYIFILATRELSTSILLYTPGKEVLAITIFELYDNGQTGAVAAIGVMMILGLVSVVMLLQWVARKFGTQQAT